MTYEPVNNDPKYVRERHLPVNPGEADALAGIRRFYFHTNEAGEFVTLTREQFENLLADAAQGRKSYDELPELIINPHDLPSTVDPLLALGCADPISRSLTNLQNSLAVN